MTREVPGILMMSRLGCVEHGGRTQACSTSKYRLCLRISETHTHGSSAEILERLNSMFRVQTRLFIALTSEQPVSFRHDDGRVIFVRRDLQHCDYFTVFTNHDSLIVLCCQLYNLVYAKSKYSPYHNFIPTSKLSVQTVNLRVARATPPIFFRVIPQLVAREHLKSASREAGLA